MFGILITLMLPLGSSYFTRTHTYWTLNAMQNVDSPITQECRPFIKETVDGNTLADVPVLFYFSSDKQSSYIFTHQKGSGFNECLREAGSNTKLRCVCFGVASHVVQDFYSHTDTGVVPDYLRRFAGANFLGHMVVEQSFQDKFLKLKKDTDIIASGTLDRFDDVALDTIFDETGGDSEILELLNKMADLDMENTARVFRSGYQGEGFFSTVYQDKVKLPFWGFAVSIILIISGLAISVFLIFTGRTGWKWVTALLWLVLLGFGILILFSFLTGTTWKITTFLIQQPPKLGYLQVSQSDVVFYDNIIQEATNQLFRTGRLPFDDASGLSFKSSEGIQIEGALKKAEGTFKFIVFPIFIILFIILNVFLFAKSYGLSFRRKGKKKQKN